MADLKQIESALRAADAAGDVTASRALAAEYLRLKGVQPSPNMKAAEIVGNDAITKGARNFNEGSSFTNNLRSGVGHSYASFGRGVGQLVGVVSPDEVKESNRLDAPLLRTGGGFTGSIGGSVATSMIPGIGLEAGAMSLGAKAPIVANALRTAGQAFIAPKTMGQAIGGGATIGLLAPSENIDQTVTNTALGAGASAGGNLLAKALKPNISPEVQLLRNEGVTPTLGEIMGGRFKMAEDKATSIPLLGDVIASGQRRAVEDLNRAALARAVNPIGQKVSGIGREGLDDVYRALGDEYDKILSGVVVRADQQFGGDLVKIRQMAQSLPAPQRDQFDRILQQKVLEKIGPNGVFDGETMKVVESELGRLASGYRGSPDFDVRQMSDALSSVQSSLRDLVGRTNPQVADRVKEINQGYAQFARLRDASSRMGSPDGVFSPAQLAAAVKNQDKSLAHGSYARGVAPMQDLSDAAMKVLGPKYPDSGTTGRLMFGGGALAGGAMIEPTTATIAAASTVPYLPLAQRLAAAIVAGDRPEAVQKMAPLVRYLTPSMALLPSASGQNNAP